MKIPLISRFFERRSVTSTLSAPSGWLYDFFNGAQTTSGRRVTEETALYSTAVFACVKVISETVASLPFNLYRRLPNGGKEKAINHPLYRILHDQPNPEMTALAFRETLQAHLLTWGNAFAYIEWAQGQVNALWPLRPDLMQVVRQSGQLRYLYTLPGGGQYVFLPDEILHIQGLSPDGIMGYSPIGYAREAVGLALATEEYGARFFGNGAKPGGVLEHPNTISPEAQAQLKKSWSEMYSGVANSHKVAILEEGMKYTQIGIPPNDAQFLETRKFQLEEIARIFRVPLHMIGDLDRSTNNNIEQQAIEFTTHTIRPWLVRWEQAINNKLLLKSEQNQYFVEHVMDGLLRGDMKTRYEAYAVAHNNGWMSANDILELENKNPVPGGDVYLLPLNMVPADQVGKEPPAKPPATTPNEPGQRSIQAKEQRAIRSANNRRRICNSHARLFADAATRIVRREKADILKAVKKHLQGRDAQTFTAWLENFYAEARNWIGPIMMPALVALAEQIQAEAADEVGARAEITPEFEKMVKDYLTIWVRDYIDSSQGQLTSVVSESLNAGEDPLAAVETRLNEWEERRPEKVSRKETVELASVAAKFVFAGAGFTRVRWMAFNKSCPYCRSLDGKVVGIKDAFIGAGEDYQPDGADTPFKPHRSIKHAPVHGGCDCQIVAD